MYKHALGSVLSSHFWVFVGQKSCWFWYNTVVRLEKIDL